MMAELTAAQARAHLSRGLTSALFREVTMQPEFDPRAFTNARSGASVKALGRIARRMQRHPRVVASAASRGAVNFLVRGCRRGKLFRFDRGTHYDDTFVCYEVVWMGLHSGRGCTTAIFTRHAIQRWIQRGGADDPRHRLLTKLDREAVAVIGHAADAPQTLDVYGVPSASDNGLWLVMRATTRKGSGADTGRVSRNDLHRSARAWG